MMQQIPPYSNSLKIATIQQPMEKFGLVNKMPQPVRYNANRNNPQKSCQAALSGGDAGGSERDCLELAVCQSWLIL